MLPNPCATSAECLQRLLDVYVRVVDEPDAVLVQTSEACIAELIRPLNCEELAGLQPHATRAKELLESARG